MSSPALSSDIGSGFPVLSAVAARWVCSSPGNGDRGRRLAIRACGGSVAEMAESASTPGSLRTGKEMKNSLIDLLKGATRDSYVHLQPEGSDGPSVRQIKALSAGGLTLRKELEKKNSAETGKKLLHLNWVD
ncbi:hypothetical protein Acr_03g0007540 [Actinidia rufa]|uniref:Uncharacterized protein n=1 Tax=Actinidia rufa TaxID=165716 RepID=A0A7J0EC68_9ERIC|nr:hypothetical protein Acr_03g0007540 [Actinidia rufa]